MRKLISFISIGSLLICNLEEAAVPEISFSSVPPQGSEADLIGKAINIDPDKHGVAVYIYVQGWWNKPTHASPVTDIKPDGSWTCDITTAGTDLIANKVAAFIIPDGYEAPILSGQAVLPQELETNAMASIQVNRPSVNAFHFSGYDWDVKTSGGLLFGPGPNVFSDGSENVWVDDEGKLHLKITYRDGEWRCAEVISDASFGYGTYRFHVESPVDDLDPNVVLGLFTWSDDPAYSYREIDVEITRWSNASDPTNAQYVVQPWSREGNLIRWSIPSGTAPTTHSFDWEADRINFVSHDGDYYPFSAMPILSEWTYLGNDIPIPGDEKVRFNLWLVNGIAPSDGQEVEVIISRFTFIPSVLPVPELTTVWFDDPGHIRLDVSGIPQLLYQLETSPDLETWTITQSQIASETTFQFTAAKPLPSEKEFYRVKLPVQ